MMSTGHPAAPDELQQRIAQLTAELAASRAEQLAAAQQARADRQRTEAIYRAIGQSMPGGAVYVFDHDLRYIVVEGEALTAIGKTRAELEGRTIWEAFDPATVAVIEPRYRRTLAGETLHFETRHGPAHSGPVVASDYRPICDATGAVIAGLLVAHDLSERSALLAQLQAHVAQLDGILAAMPGALIVYDRAGRIIRMNDVARAMLAYDAATWQRTAGERAARAVILARPDGQHLAADAYPALRALRGEPVTGESFFMHLPAQPELDRWVVLSASPLHAPDGQLLGAALTMTDVTDLYQTRTRLQEANERLEQRVQERTAELAALLEQMAVNRSQLRALSRRLVELQESERSYVADQLYNQAAQVLAAVRMQLWLLEKHRDAAAVSDATAAELASTLPGVKDALDQTILALHDLATQLRPAGLNRATLARVVGDYVARQMAAHDIAFEFDPGNTADLRVSNEIVTAVFRTVQEAVANITRHAQAGTVTLSMARAGDRLLLALRDNGIGFDPDAAPAGGVGLIAMRERIESVGGQLTITSTGRGAAVRLDVPVRVPQT